MMKCFILILPVLYLTSCVDNSNLENSNDKVKIEKLVEGPIAHESLTNDQLKNIRLIHKIFEEVYPISLEESILNFKRDQNPDNEISVWMNMSDAFKKFTSNNHNAERKEARKDAFRLILMRSMMSKEEVLTRNKFEELTKYEVQTILDSYTPEVKPIKVINPRIN